MASENLRNFGVVAVTATGALTLSQDAHAGVTLVSNVAAAQTWTLPAASGTGNVYDIWVQTTKTGDFVIQVANSDDTMVGGLIVATDGSGETFSAVAASDTITMNGSTTGGLFGSHVRVRDMATNKWAVEGYLVSSGTEATPFSAAVS